MIVSFSWKILLTWPLQGLRPKHPDDVAKLHKQLMKTTASNPNLEVYLRDEDMPERWHFSNNDRIAPLWIVPKAGWAIATKDDFDVEQGRKEGKVYRPRGLHGYDHEHPLMRAIFVARGPSFPHKPNSRVPVFRKPPHRLVEHSFRVDSSYQKTPKFITLFVIPSQSSLLRTTAPCDYR
jgi:hypothetical protein